MGCVLAQRERHNDAIGEFQASLQINPDDTEVRVALARSLEAHGDPKEAVEQYRAVLRIVNDHPEAQRRLAVLRGRSPE